MNHELQIRQLADAITYNRKQKALFYDGIIHYIYFWKDGTEYIYSSSTGGYILIKLESGEEIKILATPDYTKMENKLNEIQKVNA